MNEKRYYWLKLEETYFDLKTQKALRKLPSGADMLICYLKMQLKYLNKNGLIEFNGICNNIAEEIALDIDEEVDLVKMLLTVLTRWKVIEECSNSSLYIAEMQDRIGSKTDAAIRMKKHREKQQDVTMLQDSYNNVQKSDSIRERDREELEKEIDIEKSSYIGEFQKPTIEELEEYLKEKNYNNIDATYFYNYYQTNNWMVGKNKMKNWKTAIEIWHSKDFKNREPVPEHMNKNIEVDKATEQEQLEIEAMLGV